MIDKDDDIVIPTQARKKAYRGAFTYSRGGVMYAEETFEVFKNDKELNYEFEAEFNSRVSTGELLIIKLKYEIGRDFIPRHVVVEKTLGEQKVTETYNCDNKRNVIHYQLESFEGIKELDHSTPPKYHIVTPLACTGFLFTQQKKIETTSKNIYSLVASENQWTFKTPISGRSIAMEKVNLGASLIKVDGHELQGDQYKLYEDKTNEQKNPIDTKIQIETIELYLSKHIGIPYQVINGDTKIQIKYLNNLLGD